ncbi:MAG: FRG domain-containing protein [Oleiphilaceae bacterium]|nr:FRG domain-containing protein [Oleiphilaceae bacterium]
MHTEVAESWDHLQELLFSGAWNSDIQRHRSPYVFRGMGNSEFSLATSLMRLGGDFAQLEKHLLRNFRKYGHRSFQAEESVWHWLTMGQHHGLPTRLLDWTYSPLVGMHFATADIRYAHEDGVIWKVNYHDCYRQLPDALKTCLEVEGGNVFTVEMLNSLVTSLDAFERLSDDPFFIFFEPPSVDARIVNQHGLFSVTSQPGLSLEQAMGSTECEKIIVPASIKWEIRDKLDQANITERVLFPGLEGLSQWLKRHYSPR